MERGKRLQQFLGLLDQGVDTAKAFREAIGEFHDVEEQLRRYLDRKSLDVFAFNNPMPVVEDTFAARQLTLAESNAELGTVEVWLHENAAARPRLEQAMKDAPNLALAVEAMAFLKFSEGRDSEADALFERALAADGKLYLSAYYKAMLSPAADRRAALDRVVELNPEFAPAHAQLALQYARAGRFDSAIGPALQAQQLWPAKAGYHMLIGELLHALGRDSEAEAVARYVAERWPEMYGDAADELWQKLPSQSRKGPEPARKPPAAGTKVIHGIMTSVACSAKDQTMRIVIDGTSWTFRAVDAKITVGLSDDVWYGPDHFNRCQHLDGLRATVQFTPVAGISGDLIGLYIYENAQGWLK
jgi:tetratricopeptide (TPR) repeat protein